MHKITLTPALALGLAALGGTTTAYAGPAAAPTVFARCAVCHNAEKGAPDKIGPNLYAIYGTKAGKGKFNFSEPMKHSGIVWNEANLDKWISGPMTMMPGTYMSFPGIKDPARRAEIVAYLKSLR